MSLTTVAQLEATIGRDLTAAQQTQAAVLITLASDAIVEAAGSSIVEVTSTFDLVGVCDQRLILPVQPVTAVSAVKVDDETVTDFRLLGDSLHRDVGWQRLPWRHSKVTVTATHGRATVPGVLRLLCDHLVAAGLAQTEGGGELGPPPGVQMEMIGSWQQSYSQGATSVTHALDLTDRTRRWLRRTYGPNSHVVRSL